MAAPTIEIEVLTIKNLDEPLAFGELQALSSFDRAKCLSYRNNADRRRFVAARGLIANTLDRMVGPGWSLRIGANGRPHAITTSGSPIDFNIAHASRYTIIAAAREGHVGIDMEPMSSFVGFEEMVEVYLAPAELDRLWRAPASERQVLAAQSWVAKEALLKAEGVGLMRDPRELVLGPADADGAWRNIDGELYALLPTRNGSSDLIVGVAWRPAVAGDLRQPQLFFRSASSAASPRYQCLMTEHMLDTRPHPRHVPHR